VNDRDQPMFPSFDSIEAVLWPALALTVFVATAVIVDVMIILAARFRLVDLPNRRSAHALPTARGGGVAIVFTVTAASLVVVYRWPQLTSRIILGIILPSIVVAVVGVIDDVRPLKPLLRLGIQMAVAALMTAVMGPVTSINLAGLPEISLGSLAWPFTIVWIVGMINAFNFMDGADGMAGLGAVIVGLMVAAIAYRSHALATMLLAAFAAAGAGGFLVFNWQPARVFMGDVGSLSLGGVLGFIAVLAKQELLLLLVGGVFVVETLSVILQVGYFRMTGGKRIFRMAPLHHHFELKGMPESKIIVRCWIFSIIMALISLSALKLR